MPARRRRLAAVGPMVATFWALTAAATSSASGQTGDASVAGTWDATWAQAVRTRGGELVAIQRWGDAVLTVSVEDGAVRGTWWTEAGGVTWQVHGTVRGGRLAMDATEHDSDDPQLAVITALHFRGTVRGDRIEGEMWLDFAGRDGGAARRPWRATRRGG